MTRFRAGHRIVEGLEWARDCDRPGGLPVTRARGAKAAGLRYERELVKAIPLASHGAWFLFKDWNGQGYCQLDLLLPYGDLLVVLEAKYTWTPLGHSQIELLYRPVVEMAREKRVVGIVVCKVLLPGLREAGVAICSDLPSALTAATAGVRTVLHWLGVGQLVPRPTPISGWVASPACNPRSIARMVDG